MKKINIITLALIIMGLFLTSVAYAAGPRQQGNNNQPMLGRPNHLGNGQGLKLGQQTNMIGGIVTNINGTTITIKQNSPRKDNNATTYSVSTDKATFTKMGVATQGKQVSETKIVLSDIKVGDHILVSGTISSNSIDAATIKVTGQNIGLRNGQGGQRANIIAGTVSQVSGSTIVINGKDKIIYTIESKQATFTKVGISEADQTRTELAIVLSDIKVGDIIEVSGDISGTNISAKTITVKPHMPELKQLKNQPINSNTNNINKPATGFWGGVKNFFGRMFSK